MIYITGDIHGDPEGLFVKPFTKNLGAGDYVIICGGVRFIRQTGKSLSCSAVKNKRQLLNDRFIKAVRQRNKALYLVVRRLLLFAPVLGCSFRRQDMRLGSAHPVPLPYLGQGIRSDVLQLVQGRYLTVSLEQVGPAAQRPQQLLSY